MHAHYLRNSLAAATLQLFLLKQEIERADGGGDSSTRIISNTSITASVSAIYLMVANARVELS